MTLIEGERPGPRDRSSQDLTSLTPIPTFRDRPARTTCDVSGVSPDGLPVRLTLTEATATARRRGDLERTRWTVLLFLTTSCAGCADLWTWAVAQSGTGSFDLDAKSADGTIEFVVVTRDPGDDDPETVKRLIEGHPSIRRGDRPLHLSLPTRRAVTVVMSSDAWRSYGVLGPPFFSLVAGGEEHVVTEGVLLSPAQLRDCVIAAIEDYARCTPS